MRTWPVFAETVTYETSDDVSVDAIMMAIDAPHVGLKTKITSIETVLGSENTAVNSNIGKSETNNAPEKIEQSYFDMVAN